MKDEREEMFKDFFIKLLFDFQLGNSDVVCTIMENDDSTFPVSIDVSSESGKMGRFFKGDSYESLLSQMFISFADSASVDFYKRFKTEPRGWFEWMGHKGGIVETKQKI